jgi:hypothetical protein
MLDFVNCVKCDLRCALFEQILVEDNMRSNKHNSEKCFQMHVRIDDGRIPVGRGLRGSVLLSLITITCIYIYVGSSTLTLWTN